MYKLLSNNVHQFKMISCVIILFFTFVNGQNIRPELLNHRNWALLDRGEDCGESYAERIIGGKDASLGEYPWIARLGYGIKRQNNDSTGAKYRNLDFSCGGTIINDRYVLTAAHCPETDGKLTLVVVRLGEYDAYKDPDCVFGVCAPAVQDIEVEKYIAHPDFVPVCNNWYDDVCERREEQFHNDIALLRLAKPIEFNDYVYPACLPVYDALYNTSYEGSTMIVAGWGITENWAYGPTSQVLQKLSVPIVSLYFCNKQFRKVGFEGVITNKQLCAGGETGQDSCAGDSGGPLVKAFSFGGPVRFFVMGVVSFGLTRCATSMTPGIYTVVAEYMDWILDSIRP